MIDYQIMEYMSHSIYTYFPGLKANFRPDITPQTPGSISFIKGFFTPATGTKDLEGPRTLFPNLLGRLLDLLLE
jgi:hypothetical protein